MFVIEQPIPPAPATDFAANVLAEWNAVCDAFNEVSCLMLGSMTPKLHRQFKNYSPYEMLHELKSMFEKQAGVERFDLIQTFHTSKQKEGKLVDEYVLKMKGYVDQLERLGYVLPQDISVGLILNGITRDFAGLMRNYNMHNMGKTIGELHAMLVDGKIQKANKKSRKAKGKGKANGKENDKQGYIPKPKNPKPTAIENLTKDDIGHHYKEDYALESATRILNMVPTKKVDETPYELWYGKVPNMSYLKVWICEKLVKRDTPDKLQQRSVKCIFIGYPKKTMGYYFYFPPENKIVITRYAEFFKKNRITQEVKDFEPPQEEVIPICRSERTHRALNCLCLNVEAEEHSLGGLNEPTSYKVAMLDLESNKLLDAMNAEMQSMLDNKNLGEPHWTSVKNILKYLRNTKDMFLVYDGNPKAKLRVDCYCDAGFETDRDDIKSQTGYVFVLNGGAVD
nr:hypothetical protein [Tanacetum cinerariifolium]